MSAIASPSQDRWLDLNDILRELVSAQRLGQDTAEQCLAIRRSAVNNQQHPLEFLASQQLRELGGSLAVESEPGVFTQFFVHLPWDSKRKSA